MRHTICIHAGFWTCLCCKCWLLRGICSYECQCHLRQCTFVSAMARFYTGLLLFSSIQNSCTIRVSNPVSFKWKYRLSVCLLKWSVISCSTDFSGWHRSNIKAPYCWPYVSVTHDRQVDSHGKWSLMGNIPIHRMTASWFHISATQESNNGEMHLMV